MSSCFRKWEMINDLVSYQFRLIQTNIQTDIAVQRDPPGLVSACPRALGTLAASEPTPELPPASTTTLDGSSAMELEHVELGVTIAHHIDPAAFRIHGNALGLAHPPW